MELVAGRLVREFVAAGVEATWMAGGSSPEPAPEPGLTVIRLPVWNVMERRLGAPFPIPGPSALWRIARAVHRSDILLLHDSLYLTNVAAFVFARWLKRPVAVIQHIGEVPYRNRLLRWLMAFGNRLVSRPLLAAADQVSFISMVTERYFGTVRFRRPPVVVFNGVDTDLFAPVADDEDKGRLRTQLGLPRATPVALFVGRFVEKKGLAYLEAAARRRPDIVWALAGWGPIRPQTWSLPNVRVFEGLEHQDLAELYRAADVLVLPSAGEGFPLVMQEALACGLPVICGAETLQADPAAAPFLVGVQLNPADPAGVGQAIGDAVDTVLAEPGRSEARARFALARYAWRQSALKHLELLRAILPVPSSPRLHEAMP